MVDLDPFWISSHLLLKVKSEQKRNDEGRKGKERWAELTEGGKKKAEVQ